MVLSTKEDSGELTINVLPPSLLEATVTVTGKFANMKGTVPVPFTMDINAAKQDLRKPLTIFKAIAKDPKKATSWEWEYFWEPGVRGGRHNDHVVYCLPYGQLEMHEVNQSYGGSASHWPGSDDEYSVDFIMPVGNVVCAARPGLVVAVRIDSTKSGTSEEFKNWANYVVIKHDDGTYARYVHLSPNGSLVKIGQIVQARQPIALSGNTGWTDGPHLHFEVYVPVSGEHVRSIPVRFMTRSGVVPFLQEGVFY